jgi:hypothetical protein
MAGFYVRRGEKIFGPFSPDQLKEGAQKGQIRSGDSISPSKEGPWTPVEQVKGLDLKSDTTTPPLQVAPTQPAPMQTAPVPTAPVPTAPARRDGNTVVLPLNATLPMKCIVTGSDVEDLRQKTIAYSRSIPQIIYLLMMLAPLAAYDPARAEQKGNPPVIDSTRVSDAEDMVMIPAMAVFLIGLIGLIVSMARYKKVKLDVGIAREYRKKQALVEGVSAIFFIAGGGLAARIDHGSNSAMIAGASIGLLFFLVFYKLFLQRPRLKIIHLSEKCTVIKGAGESFLGHLEQLSASEQATYGTPPKPKKWVAWVFASTVSLAILVVLVLLGIRLANDKQQASKEAEIDLHRKVAEREPSSYAIQNDQKEKATEENPQVVSGNIFEDYDYAFSITRPSNHWQFLGEQNARQLVPEAILVLKDGAFIFSVIPEEIDASLDNYVNLIKSSYGDALIISQESLEIDGKPAVKIIFRLAVDGVEFTYVNYVVKNGRFFFQLTGGVMTRNFLEKEDDVAVIAKSFTYAEDRLPRVRIQNSIEDDYGHDWMIADNVYSNASFGFRLVPATGLRLLGGDELTAMNGQAGVASGNPTTYHIYLIERTTGNEVAEIMIAAWETEVGADSNDVETVSVDWSGHDAQQRFYLDLLVDGVAFDFAWTYFNRDGVLYRCMSWWPASQREQAAPVLKNSLGQFTWLAEDEQKSLQLQMSKLDTNNAVGIDFSQRNGVFRDFAGGYTYTLPKSLWKAVTGDTVLAEYPEARLAIENIADGVYMQIIPERDIDLSAEEYHRALLGNIEVADDVRIQDIMPDNLAMKLSGFDMTANGLVLSYRLATAMRGNRYVQMLMWSLKDNETQLDTHVSEIIKGLSLPEVAPQVTERGTRDIKDHRLGFQLSFKPGGRVISQPVPSRESIAGALVVRREDNTILAMGICASLTSFAEDLLIDGLMRNSDLIKIDPLTRVDSVSTLDGRPARRVTFQGIINGEQAEAVIWITRRGNTVYVLIALGKESLELEVHKRDFSLLE